MAKTAIYWNDGTSIESFANAVNRLCAAELQCTAIAIIMPTVIWYIGMGMAVTTIIQMLTGSVTGYSLISFLPQVLTIKDEKYIADFWFDRISHYNVGW